jgi:hypothetical protein
MVLPVSEICGDQFDSDCDGDPNNGCAPPSVCLALKPQSMLRVDARYLSISQKQTRAQLTLTLLQPDKYKWSDELPAFSIPFWRVVGLSRGDDSHILKVELAYDGFFSFFRLSLDGNIALLQYEGQSCPLVVDWPEPILINCPDGLALCGKQCVDLQSSPSFCGSCANACAKGSSCCDGVCQDIAINTAHCGACGQVCEKGKSCCAGSCTEMKTSVYHCGACGVTCRVDEACCDGVCQPTKTSLQHCGACGVVCRFDEQCCDGRCVSFRSALHCGGCGKACPAGTYCGTSSCVDCRTDADCGAGKFCRAGVCIACGIDPKLNDPRCDRVLVPQWKLARENVDVHRIRSSVSVGATGWMVAGSFASQLTLGGKKVETKEINQAISHRTDAFVALLKSPLSVDWMRTAGSASDERNAGLSIDDKQQITLFVSQEGLRDFVYVFRNDANPTKLLLNGAFAVSFSTVGSQNWSIAFGENGNVKPNQSMTPYNVASLSVGGVAFAMTMKNYATLLCNGKSLYTVGDPVGKEDVSMVAIARVDAKGNCLWGRVFGDAALGATQPTVANVSDGVLVGLGWEGTARFGAKTYLSSGRKDGVVLHLSAEGKVNWSVQLKSPVDVFPERLATDADGGVWVAGRFSTSLTVEDQTVVAKGVQSIYVMKVSAKGKLQWLRSFDVAASVAWAGAIVRGPGSSMFVAGTIRGSVSFPSVTFAQQGGYDSFIAKLDSYGTPVWYTHLAGGADDVVYSLSYRSDGRMLVTGGFTSSRLYVGGVRLSYPPLTTSRTRQGFIWELVP